MYKQGDEHGIRDLQEVGSSPSVSENLTSKKGPIKKKTVKKGESLIAGDYTLTPSSGIVSAGSAVKINVEYSAEVRVV